MKKLLLPIYQRLPGFIKNAAASWYGARRNRWRYNENSERLIKAAEERESYSSAQWEQYQAGKLDELLHRARHKVPYYRTYWDKREAEGEKGDWKKLENWPVLTKEEVRNNNLSFIADDCDTSKMYTESTSGSTGKPVTVFWSKETTETYYAIFERRMRQWHGISRHDKYAMLGGQLVKSVEDTRPPFWVKNKAMNQLYMSCFHLSSDLALHYAKALREYKPAYMYGYASAMHLLATFVLEQGLEVPRLTCAISNAEFFFEHQQEAIKQAFGCEVVNTYGMSELVAAGCTFGGQDMYLWPEVGVMEVFKYHEDAPVTDSKEEGRFVCTTLINPDMPFIRYEVGDGGVVEPCSAQEKLQYKKITKIGGRMDDYILTADGRFIGRLDSIFKAPELHLVEAQIIQEDVGVFTILVAPSPGFSAKDEEIIRQNFYERVGDVELTFMKVDSVPRTSAGKFKSVISKVKKA